MKGQTNNFVLKNRLQRTLRRNMTDAEQALWKRLRGCQVNGCKFRRQHPFRDFILDFVCLEAKLVIEIDGGQHNGSPQDWVRDQVLGSAGFRVLRFWNNQVLNEIEPVVEAIWLALEPHTRDTLRASPHLNPPHKGEEAIALSPSGGKLDRGLPADCGSGCEAAILAPDASQRRVMVSHPHPHPNPPLEGEGASLLPLQGEGGDGGGVEECSTRLLPPLPHPPSNFPLKGEGANPE